MYNFLQILMCSFLYQSCHETHFIKNQQVTIQLNSATVPYFKDMAEKKGIPYQNIINLYLTDCMLKKKELTISF